MSNIETLGIDLSRLGRDLVFETVKIFLAIEIDFLKLSRSRLLISTCLDKSRPPGLEIYREISTLLRLIEGLQLKNLNKLSNLDRD